MSKPFMINGLSAFLELPKENQMLAKQPIAEKIVTPEELELKELNDALMAGKTLTTKQLSRREALLLRL